MRHTPGPWKLNLKGHEIRIMGNVEGGPIATVHFLIDGGTKIDKANASLIAAAPEMLEELKEVRNWLLTPAEKRGDIRSLILNVGALIYKVEGK